jgi:uncharacterized membrane protein YbaN (DUF454 family)
MNATAKLNERQAATFDGVTVETSEGLIALTAPALFGSADESAIQTLLERLLLSPVVRAVSILRSEASIEIEYDRSALARGRALQTLSQLLAAAGPASNSPSLVRQYLERVPGRVTRVERRLSDDGPIAVEAALQAAANMTDSRKSHAGEIDTTEQFLMVENLIVEFDPDASRAAAGDAASIRESLAKAGELPADVTRPWVGEFVIGGVRRIVNLTAAGGCLVMSVVGVVTPGIPTVPFVLATGYFLARSSPTLHSRFRNSKFFGGMLRDYEDHGGLRVGTKRKMIVLTAGLIAITGLASGFNLPVLIVMGVGGGFGIYLITRIPTIESPSEPAALQPAPA